MTETVVVPCVKCRRIKSAHARAAAARRTAVVDRLIAIMGRHLRREHV
ncbi:hypothetical protein [Streptomyces caatingaensis]|nr:hypothetical protein [Streptomyces caatingaensis]